MGTAVTSCSAVNTELDTETIENNSQTCMTLGTEKVDENLALHSATFDHYTYVNACVTR